MRVMKWSMIALAVAAGTSQFAMASSQDEAKGFLEDQSLKLKTRFEYMNRDYKMARATFPTVTALSKVAIARIAVSANC